MVQDAICLFVETAAKAAPVSVSVPGSIRFFSDLLLFLVLAIPIISIVLAIFIWKRSRIARVLSTIFIIVAWVAVLFFLFSLPAPLIPLLIPTLLGAVVLYYLWFDKKTAPLFGSSSEMKVDVSPIKSDLSHMPGKVKLLFWLNLIPAILLALFSFVALFFLSIGGILSQNILLFAVLFLLTAVWLIVPYFIWKRNKLGRYLGIAGAFLDLFGFPIGTAFGMVLLYLFFHPEVKAYFEK